MKKFWNVNRFVRLFDDPPAPPAPPITTPGDKTYTQKELNDFLAQEKTQAKKNTQALITQLEELKGIKSLSEQQVNDLNAKIEELQNQNLSKEEIAKRDKEKLQKEYEGKLTQATEGQKTWQNRFSNKVIEVDILREAGLNDAYDAEQILDLLRGKARTVELEGEDGKLNGKFLTRVTMDAEDDKGVVKTLDLTAAEAIKLMKEQKKYANLFIVEGTGGVGGGTNRGESPIVKKAADLMKMSDEQYRKFRKENPNLLS
jgi:hypothetical protein